MNNQDKKVSHQISYSENDSMQPPHNNIPSDIGVGINYAQMFASTGAGIVIVRPNGIIEWTNQEIANILGYENPQNITNKSVRVFLAEPEMAVTWLQELEKSGIIGNTEVELKRFDGSKAHVLANAILHHNPQGELLRIGIIIIDISAQKAAQEKLRLQAIALKKVATSITICDQNYIVKWVNPATSELTGFGQEELIDQEIEIFSSDLNSPATYQEIRSQLQAGKSWRGELIAHHKNGGLVYEDVSITPVENEDNQLEGFITIRQDISERVRVEEDVRAYAMQLEKKERQEAILARLTASFNRAINSDQVLDALRLGLHDLGYEYFSAWERRGERLYWKLSVNELPPWFNTRLTELTTRFLHSQRFEVWAPLFNDHIYSRCYNQQQIQTTQNNRDTFSCIHVGNSAFEDLPGWLQNAIHKMVEQLNIQEHNAFPLGEFGIVFFSVPKKVDSEDHHSWILFVLQQAQAALERILSTEALRESEMRYRSLFERTNGAVLIVGTDLIIKDVNQQTMDMLGYEIDELIGADYKQFVATEEAAQVDENLMTVLRGHSLPIYLRTFIHKNGKRVLAEVTDTVAYDTDDKPSSIQVIALDLNERIKTQEQLHLQATAMEASANGIMITDIDGTIQWVNPAVCQLTGYEAQELIGDNPRILKSGKQEDRIYQELWTSILSGENWHGELINRRKDGELYYEEMDITPVKDHQGKVTRFIAIKRDVSERVHAKLMFEHLATHDPLTDLANRSLFSDRSSLALSRAKRVRQKVAVLFIDMDNFKQINDTYGHETGDRLLQGVADRLSGSVRGFDEVARMGGDEFTILIENLTDRKGAASVAQKILDSLADKFSFGGIDVYVKCSIGISIFPEDGNNIKDLLSKADIAMYTAKRDKDNQYRFYAED